MDLGNTLESPKGVYKIVRQIGKGTFGEVYLADYTAKNASTSEQVAVKELALHGMDEKEKKECNKEAEVMEQISESSTSPHVVKYFDSFMMPSYGNLYIAMDYCSCGDLRSKIRANIESGKEFDPKIVYDYIYQIADGINELHKHKIAHRDLKPANILISWEDGKEVLKISDFGLVKVLESISITQSHSKWCGTPLYMAPEQHTLTPCRFPVVDIWTIGIIFYELCITPKRLTDEMDDIRTKFIDDLRAKDTTWLNKMIAKDRYQRMRASQICEIARGKPF
ncbi:hypothetical protein WR25_18150 [Diploscapter pachys]|uniref:non-specific serine/threonine protein kinase n=1 Tax=Diploscapter pachys TaxID=2018661 RepID=A0A2A2KIL0_9BILA|nr:hypothetical protein WR25_18150 [Diploscapter pachys]